MTRQTIDQMISALIDREGGYVFNRNDAGGETKFGITRDVAKQFGYVGAMFDLPRSTAEAIYRKQYFESPGFDHVLALSAPIAEEMFDTGVNMGVTVPGQWLQRLLNALTDGAPLTVDGKVGPATISALQAYLKRRGTDGETVLVRGLNCLQGVKYLEITEARVQNKSFIFGWLLNRVS